jgi:hypothetical protein
VRKCGSFDGRQGNSISASEDEPGVDLPAFVCSPLNAHPFTIVLVLSLCTLNNQIKFLRISGLVK